MPSVSQAPIFNKIAYITGDHVVSRDESIASIKTMPTGGLEIFLPGPTAPFPPGGPKVELPDDGDYYAVQDVKGLVSVGNSLTVSGSGYPIMWNGVQAATIETVGAGSGGEFTFHVDAQAWYFCPCRWVARDA